MTSTSEMAAQFNEPSYWLGGGHGYTNYQDFAVNQLKAEQVMELQPRKLLEVGCAYGFNVARFRKLGVSAFGFDISDFALSQATADVSPYLTQGMAHQLPYTDNEFDTLCCFGMLEHVPEEYLVPTLKEFARVSPRGLLSITMKGDPTSDYDSSHTSLLTHREWQNLVKTHCPDYEVCTDTEELWELRASRRWAIVAPTIYPIGKSGYAGIERLVTLFLKRLVDEARTRVDWKVVCYCSSNSVLPRGAQRINSGPPLMDFSEPNLPPPVIAGRKENACFLDFSHSKPTAHLHPVVPHLAVLWHDPFIMQPPQPKNNVVALSEWQAQRFREAYNQDCIVLDPICGDGDVLRPGYEPEDYLVFLGKLSPDKGALEAIEACRALKQKLVLIGPVTPGDPPEYVNRVLGACDGVDIVYHQQVTAAHKVQIFQNAKALLYPVSYPAGQGEAHSHKSIEAMLCGTPCILWDQGAMREVVDEGITGFVIPGRGALEETIKACETLDREKCRERAMERWDYRRVVDRWLPIMDSVSRGDRW